MTADRRNTAVVVALILSLTLGARLLTWLEPAKPHWKANPLLMAQRGLVIDEVEIVYVPTSTEAEAIIGQDALDSLCVVWPDQPPEWWAGGPRVQLVVVGSSGHSLGTWQKESLLATLGSLSQASGQDLVRVRLAEDSDALLDPELPPQAADLRELLARKRIIE